MKESMLAAQPKSSKSPAFGNLQGVTEDTHKVLQEKHNS